ncbi:RNA recognition motif protein, putative (macronuclear) [Tetrahymena thermophila SB210]|uniref:RNA recognition motif protein, putative n=1 Tax=Tetrahymena thermophila (strain SB210) TaxID=312017 RepID=I7MKF6_TETTS|nr:RNA recognition motif protein, putative [Tetrahymena thermophila SB210]EAR98337.4 RNA recognition motif protein, putative [Tetrahymena thermophila SB210]|eukprot:XP_001018582.4 RNA recognition motif protein, putative [Tetrahymena thermophila SB210]
MSSDKNKGGFKVVNGPKSNQGALISTLSINQANSNQNLQEQRIIQTNLVFLNGLDAKLCKEEVLKKKQYMGQYGNVKKVILKQEGNRDQNSVGVYVSYSSPNEASIAILALDQFELDSKPLRAFYGSTKYCNSFLNGQQCIKKDCPYLHEKAKEHTFYKDQRFYINYKEIALKIVNQKISFYNNYSSVQNPIFPDVMIVLNELKSQLQIPDTLTTAVLKANDSKNSAVIINNITACTWDDDDAMTNEGIQNQNQDQNQNFEIQNQEYIQNQDINITQKDINLFNQNTNQLQHPLFDLKSMNTLNYYKMVEKLDLPFQNPNLYQLLQQPDIQQQLGINQYINRVELDSINYSPNQFYFDDKFQLAENSQTSRFFNDSSKSFKFKNIWGPVGQKKSSLKIENPNNPNYINGLQGNDCIQLPQSNEEDEFSVLNTFILAYNITHSLWIPYVKLQNLTEKIFKKLLVDQQISQFSFNKYMFDNDNWMLEFLENNLFTDEEKEIILSAARSTFKDKNLLYVDIAPQCVDLFTPVVEQKQQLQEVQTIFTLHPNHQKQRKRSSNSLQSTNHSSMGGELADLEESKHNEENSQLIKSNIFPQSSNQSKTSKTKLNNNAQSSSSDAPKKAEEKQQSVQNINKPIKSSSITSQPSNLSSSIVKNEFQIQKQSSNQNSQKLELNKSASQQSSKNINSTVNQQVKTIQKTTQNPASNTANTNKVNGTKVVSSSTSQQETQIKKQESEKEKNEQDEEFVSIQPKGGAIKLELADKKKERVDNNMFTFLENEQEEDEDKDKDKEEQQKQKNDNTTKKQKTKVKQAEKPEKKTSKKMNSKQLEQQQLKEEKKKRQEEYQLLNEQLNLIKQEKEKNKQKQQEQKQEQMQQQQKKKQKEQEKEQQQQAQADKSQILNPLINGGCLKFNCNSINCHEISGQQILVQNGEIQIPQIKQSTFDKKRKKRQESSLNSIDIQKQISNLMSIDPKAFQFQNQNRLVNQQLAFHAEASVTNINVTKEGINISANITKSTQQGLLPPEITKNASKIQMPNNIVVRFDNVDNTNKTSTIQNTISTNVPIDSKLNYRSSKSKNEKNLANKKKEEKQVQYESKVYHSDLISEQAVYKGTPEVGINDDNE